MFRFIGIAIGVAVGVWLALRRRPPLGGGGPGAPKTHTTIVIGGSASAPRITGLPERLVAQRGKHLLWDISNTTGAPQEISLRGFKERTNPGAPPPLERTDVDRTVRAGQSAEIRDRVRGNATAGTYKYDIWLNGVLAVDPDVVIYE